MARPEQGLLRPLLLAVCLLVLHQVTAECCSTPPLSPSPSPADHLDEALRQQLLMLDAAEARTARPPTRTVVVAGDGMTGGDDAVAPCASATTPARAAPAAVIAFSSWPLQTSDRALVRAGRTPPEPEVLLRSKLARRFLAGAGAGVDEAGSATDGTAPSCHSFNPHANCPPAASKP